MPAADVQTEDFKIEKTALDLVSHLGVYPQIRAKKSETVFVSRPSVFLRTMFGIRW
jgi:hypothetical protein